MLAIDLNCDMGEGAGNDEVIMPYISSANIACGYHAGDLDTMKRTVESAINNKVSIGAHPGFKDPENFGRTEQQLSDEALYDTVSEQLHIMKKITAGLGAAMHHVKPHGAMYNMAAVNQQMASVIAKAIREFDAGLLLYGLSGSFLIAEAKQFGLKTANEVFADRAYMDNGTLVPRKMAGALIHDEEESIQQVMKMVLEKKVKTINGKIIPMEADTICIHGDGEHAFSFAKKINQALKEKEISIQSINNP